MKTMKIIREFIAFTAIFMGMTGWAGDSAPFLLDTIEPFVETGGEVSFSYNSSWIGGDPSAEIVILADGTEIKRTTGEGDFTWSPITPGKHTLTYTTFINGVAQDEVYEAIVYADWKYTVEDGKATIVETTQKSGSVTIPSEIDGFPVVGLGDGLFDGCEGLTSVTIPDSVASVGKGAFDGCTGIRSVSLSPTFKIRSFSSGLIQAKFNSSDDFTSSIIDSESKSLVSGVLMGDAYDTESVTRTYTDPKYGGSYKWNSRYTTFGYAGYMYMVEGRTYVFGKYFDDSVLVRINGNEVLKNTDHTAFATGKYIPEKTGWHEIEVRVADGTGEKGPKGVQNGGYWSGNLGVGWRDDGITDALPESGWKKMIDPGDGSLFRCLEEVQDLTMRGLFADSYDKLTNATLIGDAAVIPNNAFAGCAALESFTIPDSVYSIGANAFANCTSLTNVSMPFPLKVQVESGNVFDGCSENLEIVYRTAQIKNVVAKQRFPWNGKVDVSFDIEGNALAGFSPNNLPSLVVTAEDRKIGEKYIASNAFLSGDIDLTTGTHKIVWDLKSNGYEFKSDDIVISVACKSIEGLISQYLFNDDLCDSSNNNYDLSGQEGCFVADRKGVDNGAYSFNGAKQSVTSTDCRLETEFTFAFWFKTSVSMSARGTGVATSGYSGWYGNYVLFPRNCGSDAGFGAKIGTDGISVIAHGDGYLSEQLGYSANIGTGWNHIAVSVSSDGSIGIYLNGVCVKTGTKSSSRKSVFVPEVGGGPYGYYTGCIDELLVFDKELDADTIALIYSDCVIVNDWDAIYEGESSSILVDTYPAPLFEMGVDKISYNSSWIGGESSAEVVISDNGTEIKRTTGEGEFAWSPTTVGKHTLTYTTYIDGIQQEEVYTATVFKDWKYTVSDDKATIVETTQKSGSVTIPSEIDGFPVVGLGEGLFKGSEGLTSIVIPDSIIGGKGGWLYDLTQNDWAILNDESDDETIVYKSNDINHKGSTYMTTTVEGPLELSFDWKVSSENRYDYLKWYLDGIEKSAISGTGTDWQTVTISIPTGEHKIKWQYSKDASGDSGEDCGWVRLPRILMWPTFEGCTNLTQITMHSDLITKMSYMFPDSYDKLTCVTLTGDVTGLRSDAFAGCSSIVDVVMEGDLGDKVVPGFYEAEFRSMSSFDDSRSIIDHSRGIVLSADMLTADTTDELTMYGYAAKMYFEGGIEYGFLAYYDDKSSVKIDGVNVISASSVECRSQTCTVKYEESGWHDIELRGWNNGSEGAAYGSCEGIMWKKGSGSWQKFADPGDGSLFRVGATYSIKKIFPECFGKIKRIVLTEEVTEIPDGFFAGCAALESFIIPDSVTKIGANAFDGCSSLTEIVIPDSVYSIGANAFANCTSLTNVSMPIPLKVQVESGNVFDGCSENLEIVYRTAQIKNVVAKQRFPWNGKVDIKFKVVGNINAGLSSENPAELTVTAKDIVTGEEWIAKTLTGDAGTNEGEHHVVWDMKADGLSFYSQNIKFKVGYFAKSRKYCVIDLSAGKDATEYPVSYLADVPEGGWTDEYKTTKLVLRRIDSGSFKMGGSYDVTLTKPYYMGVFEVTQKQYELVTGSKPSMRSGNTLPVEQVSWNTIRGNSSTHNWPTVKTVDSNSFVGRLQARTGLNFDLPTEAQWEYACRAGTMTTYYWGNSMDGAYAWYSSNASSTTHVVGMRTPNAWGLYDMSGNVWEWCLDWYGDLVSAEDPKGASSGSARVLRSGSWYDSASSLTSSLRSSWISPSTGKENTGFRLTLHLGE